VDWIKVWSHRSHAWIAGHPWQMALLTGAVNAGFVTALYSMNNPYPWLPPLEHGLAVGFIWFLVWGTIHQRLRRGR
jgi:hypothetical protein